MGEVYNIEHYRKKKKKKKLMSKALMVLLILLLGFAGFLIVRSISDNHVAGNPAAFPVSFKGETPYDLNQAEGNLIVTTETQIKFYSSSARNIASYHHSFSRPITKIGGARALTYDQGGYQLRIDTKNNNIKEMKTATPILFCEINASGYYAVVTSENRYTNSVTVYNSSFKQIYKYSAQEYIMALDFKDNNNCIVAAQTAKSGDFDTVIYGLNFKKDAEAFKSEVLGIMALAVDHKSNDAVALVGSQGLTTLNKKGEVQKSFDFAGEISNIYENIPDHTVVTLKNTTNPNETDIFAFSQEGALAAQSKLQGIVQDLYCDKNGILMLDKNTIFEYNYSLEQLQSYENDSSYQHIIRMNGVVYALGTSQLQKFEPQSSTGTK